MDLVGQVTDAYLQTAKGSDSARLRFLQGLWDIQSRIETADRRYDAPDADAVREALATGKPLFSLSAPEVPVAQYVDAVSRIANYASEMAGLPAEQAEALRAADFSGAIDAVGLSGAVLSPEAFVAQVAGALGVEAGGPLTRPTVAFVLISALVPFLTGPSQSVREVVGGLEHGAGADGRCSVCGSSAAIGAMGESTALKGGERTLWCGLCHAEWGYERLRCVRCGSTNPDVLRYTYVEGDPAHRVHLCDECHGYTKFVFVDDLGKPLSMVVEDAVTANLDAVASEQGYTSTGDGGKARC
jgi:FdhE protein